MQFWGIKHLSLTSRLDWERIISIDGVWKIQLKNWQMPVMQLRLDKLMDFWMWQKIVWCEHRYQLIHQFNIEKSIDQQLRMPKKRFLNSF